MQDTLKIAYANYNSSHFEKKYEAIDHELNENRVEISLSNIFTKATSHLVIKRFTPYEIFIDIFSKENGTFKNILSINNSTNGYKDHLFKDINGDSFPDFVLNTYRLAGCDA